MLSSVVSGGFHQPTKQSSVLKPSISAAKGFSASPSVAFCGNGKEPVPQNAAQPDKAEKARSFLGKLLKSKSVESKPPKANPVEAHTAKPASDPSHTTYRMPSTALLNNLAALAKTPVVQEKIHGRTVLEWAALAGNPGLLESFKGDNPKVQNLKTLAIRQYEKISTLKKLPQKEKDLLLADLVQQNASIEEVLPVIVAGAQVNQRTKRNTSLIHTGVMQNNLPLVQALIAGGADVNLTNAIYEQPLHHALQKGHLAIATELVRAGADKHQSTLTGQTPSQLLEQLRLRTEIQQLELQKKPYKLAVQEISAKQKWLNAQSAALSALGQLSAEKQDQLKQAEREYRQVRQLVDKVEGEMTQARCVYEAEKFELSQLLSQKPFHIARIIQEASEPSPLH